MKQKIKTVILGCTHYPILKPVLRKILGKDVQLVDPADTLADRVRYFLDKDKQLESHGVGELTIYASDDPERFKRLATHLLGEELPQVHLQKLL